MARYPIFFRLPLALTVLNFSTYSLIEFTVLAVCWYLQYLQSDGICSTYSLIVFTVPAIQW